MHLKRKQEFYSIKPPKPIKKEVETLSEYPTEESEVKDDLPRHQVDPYKKKQDQCIFCKFDIPLDYKNVQLLSQFVSPNTGITYSQQATGLCYYKYVELKKTIVKARRLGLMPFFYKETTFTKDQDLFNPSVDLLRKIANNYDQRKLNSDD